MRRHAIDAATGRRLWHFSSSGAVFAAPVVAGSGSSLLLASGSSLYNISTSNASAATLLWKFTAGDWCHSSAVISSDGTVLIGCDDGNVYAPPPLPARKNCNTFGQVRADKQRRSPVELHDGRPRAVAGRARP